MASGITALLIPVLARGDDAPEGQPAGYEATAKALLDPQAAAPLKEVTLNFDDLRVKSRVAGIALGDSMDTVIAAWGKPANVSTMHKGKIWTHSYSNATVLYHDYKVVQIGIGRYGEAAFSFDNGLSSKSTLKEVKALLGSPKVTNHASVAYVDGERLISVSFMIKGQWPNGDAEWETATVASISIEGRSTPRGAD